MHGRPPRLTGRRLAALFATCCLTALAGAAFPTALCAQRVLGGGSDGVTLPRGAFRVGLGAESMVQRDRWNDGQAEGLVASMEVETFGLSAFPTLRGLNHMMQGLGVTNYFGNLGRSRIDARQRAFVTPLSVEYGVADWLTIGARATLVRTKAEALFRLDPATANLGVNPNLLGTGVGAANEAIQLAYAQAAIDLFARRDACQANAGAHPECPTILAELASVAALNARTSQFLQGMLAVYGNSTSPGFRWVPYAGSAADSTVHAHADSLRTAFERYGVTNVTSTTGYPAGAQVPLRSVDLDALITDSAAFGARPLNDAGLTQVGDVHLSALIRVYDSFTRGGSTRFTARRGIRQSFLLEGRIGTSTRPRADRFLDQGTGEGTHAVTIRSITDAAISARFWGTLAVSVTQPFARDVEARMPFARGFQWAEWWRQRTVRFEPGAEIDVEFSPRWQLNDYIALGGQVHHRLKGADRYAYAQEIVNLPPSGFPFILEGSSLDGVDADETRAGLTLTYSTLASIARGHRAAPFEVSYVHQQSVASGAGVVPRQWQDRIQVRYYTRFLGR